MLSLYCNDQIDTPASLSPRSDPLFIIQRDDALSVTSKTGTVDQTADLAMANPVQSVFLSFSRSIIAGWVNPNRRGFHGLLHGPVYLLPYADFLIRDFADDITARSNRLSVSTFALGKPGTVEQSK